MLRFGEFLIPIAPLVAGLLLYAIVVRGHRPSARVLTLAGLVVTMFGVWLIWTGTSQGLDRRERYVPAQMQGGAIVQGHGG